MPLVTLKKYLGGDEADLRSAMSLMFKGVAAHAIRADEQEHAHLVAALERIEAGLQDEFTAEKLLVAAGAAMQSLESYSQRTSRFIRRQGAELQKIAGMLAETVLTIGGASQRSAKALGEIQANLEQANGLEDLQNVKARLSTCLEQVCQESARRKEESDGVVAELQSHIRRAELHLKFHAQVDPVTELPGPAAADAAMQAASTQPGRKYVAVLVLDRLQSINTRFGKAIGDQVFAEMAHHIAANLSSCDALFRWTGPALLALLPRELSIDRMRSDLKPVFGKPLEKEFDVGGRHVLIPASPAWAVFGLIPPVATIRKHVDAFVASQAPGDYV